ncbi:MAG: hypothetical protein DI543_03160 [Bradyrhizobium icense]|nr:MAG: hypothetical protein DI543_03160 [Bradyrhizobium icense]
MTQPADPPSTEGERRHRSRFDLTINLPTMITLAVLTVTVSAWGVGIYSNLDKRQMVTDLAVAALTQRVDRVEGTISNVRADQIASSKSLRDDMKSEMTEIKGMLNQIIFRNPSANQRQLKEWSKD